MKKSEIDRILGRSTKVQEKTSQKDDDLNVASRVGLTALDVVGNIGKGAVKTLEGIYDEGATLVGAIGGIFDSDFKDDVAEHIKYDVTDKVFDSMGFDYVEDNSYLEGNKVGEFARGVSSGIGGMLPSVALGFIPGAGVVLAPVSMGVGAAGQATESALNKGAGYYGSALYGAGMGIVEGATEALGGYMLGGGKSLIGKALAGTKLGKFTSKGIGKVAETFISEGVEESLTDLIDPALQYATGVDKNIGKNYKEAIKGLPQTFLIGGTVGSIMQGGNVTMNALRNSQRGGFKATRADEAMSYIGEVSKNYGKDTSKNTKYDKAIDVALHDISRELTSMSKDARKAYMDGMGVFKNAFNDDGSIKMDLRADANEGAVSNNLRSISAVFEHAPIASDVEISEGAAKAKNTVERLLGERANVVVSDKIGQNNASYNPDEGIIYINNNAEFTGEEIAEFVATHEVAHITEGTKEYIKLNQMLEEIAKDPSAPAALKAKIGNVAQRQIEIGELYQEQMEGMTDEQKAYLIRTELNADLVGILLGDEYFIEKLAQRDASLVQKIFNKLKSLTKKSTTIDKGSAKYLNKLVSKFGKAIDKSQGGVKFSQLGREDEEKNGENSAENVDFIDEKRYNKSSGAYSQYKSLAMQWANATNTKKGSTKMLYNAQNDTWNLIIADDSDMGYSELVSVKDTKENANYIKSLFSEVKNESNREQQKADKGFSERLRIYWNESGYGSDYNYDAAKQRTDERTDNVYTEQSASDRTGDFGKSKTNNGQVKKATRIKEIRFDDDGNVIDEVRYSISKNSKFAPGRHAHMQIAEELVKGYDDGTLTSEDAVRKLNALGYQTGINADNALDMLEELIPEIRDFATSEREAYRESNRKETAEFIESVSKMNDKTQISKRKKRIGKLSREHAEIVNNLMKTELPGFSADGYELWIDGTGAKHIEDRHGKNGSADNSMASMEAKELISWASQNAENGYFIKENNGEIRRSKRFFNSDGSRAPEIRLEKQIDGDTMYVSECVPDSSNRRIWITSAYIKKGSKGQLLNMDENSSPQPTPEASFDSTATNTIITENSQKSNSEQKKSKLTSKKAIKSLVLDVADIFSQTTENGEDVAFLPKEAETNIVTAIWKKVNAKGVYNMKNFANRMAKQIMQNIVLGDGNVYKVNTTLKSIMHRIDLSEFEERISSKDKLKYSSRWQLQEGKETIAIEDAVAELNNLGFQILSIDKLQMMEEINHIYEDTKLYMDEKDGKSLAEIMGEKEYKKAQSKISDKILDTLTNAEKQTESELHNVLSSLIIENANVLEKYRNYRKEFKQDEKRLRKELVYVHQIEEINAQRKHTYTPAQQPKFNELADIQKLLGKTIHNGNINLSSFRESMGALSKWYTKDNELIGDAYDSDMADVINYFKDIENAEREPSNSEIDAMIKLAAYVKNFSKNFGKIYRAGHWVEITDIAIKDFKSKSEAIDSNTPLQSMCQRAEYIENPLAVASMWDGHDPEGELTRFVTNLQHGELRKAKILMDVHEQVTKIMGKDKKLFNDVISGNLKVKCGLKLDLRNNKAETIEIPVDVLVNMYNTLRTKGEDDFSLEETGYSIKHANSAKKDIMAPITPEEIKNAYNSLPEPIKELAEWMIKWNNTEGKRYKMEADLRKKGFSNVIEGDYWNEIREHYEGTNDMQRRFGSNGIGAHGFNYERVKGAKARFVFDGFIEHFFNHVEELLNYNILDPIKTDFDKVMQVNINVNEDGTVGAHKSIKMLVEEQGFFHYGLRRKKDGGKYTALDYMEDLSNNVFGVKTKESSEFNAIIGWLRGGYATYALGANIKVLGTQFSSLIAGFGELRATSVLYGAANILNPVAFKNLAKEVDTYCDWAKVRHFEKGATKAMTLTDKVSKVREWFTKPIEIFDRLIVMLEFKACQKEVESRYHLKMGTEENKIKAGQLLTEVGLKTQQNQYISTRSAIARSDSEIAKGLAMFRNDATAVTSGVVQHLTAWSVINKKIKLAKEAGDTARVAELEKLRNQARRKTGKYATVVILSCAYMTLLARLFNKLYHQDEDDEMTVGDIMLDFFGNFLGMFPIASEIGSFLIDGYDVDNSIYSTLNNALGAIGGTIEIFQNAINGKEIEKEKLAGVLRNDIYAVGQIFGVPARNLYKNAKMIVGWASPSTEDKMDAWFKAPSSADLEGNIKEGIEKGDNKAVSTSLSLLYDKYDLELKDAVLRGEYDRLMRLEMTKSDEDKKNGIRYTPLEAKIPNSIKIDDEEVELTRKDINAFKNAFSEAEKSQAKIVKTVPYKKLNDEQRAYALRKISQYYFEDTKYTYTGDKSNFAYYAKVVGVEDLALILAYAKGLKGDEEQSLSRYATAPFAQRSQTRRKKIEAYIRSLRLNSVQASLALRCLGYGDKENDKLVVSYVKRCYLLTENERAEFGEILDKTIAKEDEKEKTTTRRYAFSGMLS